MSSSIAGYLDTLPSVSVPDSGEVLISQTQLPENPQFSDEVVERWKATGSQQCLGNCFQNAIVHFSRKYPDTLGAYAVGDIITDKYYEGFAKAVNMSFTDTHTTWALHIDYFNRIMYETQTPIKAIGQGVSNIDTMMESMRHYIVATRNPIVIGTTFNKCFYEEYGPDKSGHAITIVGFGKNSELGEYFVIMDPYGSYLKYCKGGYKRIPKTAADREYNRALEKSGHYVKYKSSAVADNIYGKHFAFFVYGEIPKRIASNSTQIRSDIKILDIISSNASIASRLERNRAARPGDISDIILSNNGLDNMFKRWQS